MTAFDTKGSLVAGVLAALGASLCCVVPLVLLALGTPGTACADPKVLARQRTVFWVIVVLLGALLAAPWIAPLFY